jgi:hypothetical protein
MLTVYLFLVLLITVARRPKSVQIDLLLHSKESTYLVVLLVVHFGVFCHLHWSALSARAVGPSYKRVDNCIGKAAIAGIHTLCLNTVANPSFWLEGRDGVIVC